MAIYQTLKVVNYHSLQMVDYQSLKMVNYLSLKRVNYHSLKMVKYHLLDETITCRDGEEVGEPETRGGECGRTREGEREGGWGGSKEHLQALQPLC